MTYQTLPLTWQGITFTLAFAPDYLAGVGMAHLEIRSKEPLPVTETGYKSIFVPKADIADIRIAAALILQTLDMTAKRTGWKRQQQLSLF